MKRILIIDDEKKIRRIYKDALTMEGFDVLESDDVWVGVLEAFKSDNIDLIIWGITPFGTLEDHLLNIAREYDLKFKVIVSGVFPLNQQEDLVPGANDYFDKTEGIDALIRKINKVLQ